jgi:hypothetical protein
MSSGASRLSARHRSREEIIELFRAGAANPLTASALMRLVEDSIRDRSKFSLGDFERQLFAHKIIAT